MSIGLDIQRALIARGISVGKAGADGIMGNDTWRGIDTAVHRLPLEVILDAVNQLPVTAYQNDANPENFVIDRAKFFSALRSHKSSMFGSSFTASQVNGIEGILDGFAATGDGRIETLAYGLATARREVGSGMVPVREGFKKTDAEARAYVAKNYPNKSYSKPKPPHGFVYYGRGLVQLTHDCNYEAEGILDNPDKALEPEWAAELLFKGLLDGRWNKDSKGISFYLPTGGPYDLKNARRTVNLTDHWSEIADYFNQFMAALKSSQS